MKYTIIGGGVSGLSAAHYLTKLASTEKVVILEAANRLGGWINTSRLPDGVFYEHGPRTIRPAGVSGANTLEIIEELGIEDKIIPLKAGHPATKNRLVLVDSILHALPSGPKSLLFPKKPFTKPLFLAGVKDLFTPRKTCEDDTIYNFIKRRFGNELAEFAIDPLVRGICAGDAREISADSFVASDLFRMEQQYGGVFQGLAYEALTGKLKAKRPTSTSKLYAKAKAEKWSIWRLQNGLQTLVEAFESKLVKAGVEIRTNVNVEEINTTSDGKSLIIKETKGILKQDHVISALPAYGIANLIRNLPSLEESHKLLSSIPYVNVAVVNVEYSGNVLNREPAFGLLIPSSQKEPILGVIFDSASFPQGDRTIFTAMMGGRWFERNFGENPSVEHLEKIAQEQIEKILEIKGSSPVRVSGKILRQCIPQFTVGHRSRVTRLRQVVQDSQLPLTILGSAFDGVGVNDAMLSGRRGVERIAAALLHKA